MTAILQAGLHFDVPAAAYHADPAPEPSLSSSIAKVLLEQSPRHAWQQHPRLNPAGIEEASTPTRPMEIGTVVHALLLGRGGKIVVVSGDSYQKKDAQAARAAAYGAGDCPILETDLAKAEAIVAAAREQLAEAGFADAFAEGMPEPVLIWKDKAGPWCRAMVDWLFIGDGTATIIDIKTSNTSISPHGDALAWKVADMAYDVSAAFYERGLATLRPDLAGRINFRHLWLEMEQPHSLAISDLTESNQTHAHKMVAAAMGLWRDHLAAGTDAKHWPRWPAYVGKIQRAGRSHDQWNDRTAVGPLADIINSDPFVSVREVQPYRERDDLITEIAS